MSERQPAAAVAAVVDGSDDWELSAWTTSDLVLSRAALKHMLTLVEKELGTRQHMPTRGRVNGS